MSCAGQHAALLLAAGGSRRLGRPKALLMRDGEPLVRRAARLLLDTGPTRLVVVLGADAETIGSALDGLALQRVFNPSWAQGMSTSLQAGANALASHDGATLVATVDQLHLAAAHLTALLSVPDPARDVVSSYGEVFGVPARLSIATLRAAGQLQGERGFAAFWRQGELQPLRIDAPELAFDLDTPDDLQRAIDAGWIDPP